VLVAAAGVRACYRATRQLRKVRATPFGSEVGALYIAMTLLFFYSLRPAEA
jgi:hypothetical protein